MMRPTLTPQDWETLSVYLDGQLTETEKRQVQDLMALRPELKQGLEELRRTRAVLRAAPHRRAPRNFTLSAEMAHKARPRFRWAWMPSFSFASAMATLLLVLSFFFRVNLGQVTVLSPMAAQAPMSMSQQSSAENSAPIITWNQPYHAEGVGGGPEASGMGSAEKATAPTAQDSQALPPYGTSEPATAYPSPDTQTDRAMVATPSAAPMLAAPLPGQSTEMTDSTQSANSSGPILGIAPTEEQGRMFVPAEASSAPIENYPADRWVYVQIGLAGVALVFALAAFFTWRRAQH